MQGRPSPRALAAALLAVLAFLLPALVPSAAHADYTVWSCRGPDGTPVSPQAWVAQGSLGTRADTCADGGSLRVTLPDAASDAGSGGYGLTVPAGTGLTRIRVWAAASTAATTNTGALGAGLVVGSGAGAQVFGCPESGSACTSGDPATPLADANQQQATTGLDPIVFTARCSSLLFGCPTASAPAASAQLFRSAVDVTDTTPPTVSAAQAGAPAAGVVTVTADASDAGGGILRRELLVDGAVAQTAPADCAAPYTRFAPCPATAPASFPLDTATLTAGPHQVAIRATDAGGATTTGAPVEVAGTGAGGGTGTGGGGGAGGGGGGGAGGGGACVGGTASAGSSGAGCAGACVGGTASAGSTGAAGGGIASGGSSGAAGGGTASGGTSGAGCGGAGAGATPGAGSAGASLPATARIALPTRIALPHGGPITGRVVGPDGAALAGVRVTLSQRAFGSAESAFRTVTTATTGADGSFLVSTRGDSRIVRAALATPGTTAAPRTVRLVEPLRVRVAAPKATVGYGARFALTGRLTGAGATAAGKLVRIQAIVSGRWTDVAKTRATASGAIRWTYQLRNTHRPSDYRFRLRIPKIENQPWAEITSRPVTVKVRAR